MIVANAGAMFGMTRVLMPVGLVALIAGKRSDKRRKARDESTASRTDIQAIAPKRPSKRRLRSQLAAGADPRSLVLRRSNLAGVDLSNIDLGAVDLTGAHLRGANLSNADLTDTLLRHADLSGADLRGATLAHVDLTDCDLTGADLRGADLSRARNLSAASLRRACHSRSTRWPTGFDPAGAGAAARAD